MASSIIRPIVVDIYRLDEVNSFQAAWDSGIRGVIHKASEGTSIGDNKYATRKVLAQKVGMLWGAYHFLRPGNVSQQVDWFLGHAMDQGDLLLALDYEDDSCGIEEAREFLQLLAMKTGRKGVLYSGNTVKEKLHGKDAFFGGHRLWLAQYTHSPSVQESWSDWWLWQFTGDGNGPEPHTVPGMQANMDIDSYKGSFEQLEHEWSGMNQGVVLPPVEVATFSTEWVQASLNITDKAGLKIDGDWGPKTTQAVLDYQAANGLKKTGKVDDPTIESILSDLNAINEA
jgi:GH25 family lysozyme M1 (1,4-beta-N-acetylmuramidase)